MTLEEPRHWHVIVTVAGAPVEPLLLRSSLMRFADERPFLSRLRFVADAVEFSYWDEGRNAAEVTALALGVWRDHRQSAMLPDWEVVGLVVQDRESWRGQCDGVSRLAGAAEITLTL